MQIFLWVQTWQELVIVITLLANTTTAAACGPAGKNTHRAEKINFIYYRQQGDFETINIIYFSEQY